MTTEMITTGAIVQVYSLAEAGQAANGVASQSVFGEYQQRKSINSLAAQYHDLATFAAYLCDAKVDCPTVDDLKSKPETWQGVTWGLVAGFVKWMLREGLALSSINRKLSTVKVYAGLAAQAGVIGGADLALIK